MRLLPLTGEPDPPQGVCAHPVYELTPITGDQLARGGLVLTGTPYTRPNVEYCITYKPELERLERRLRLVDLHEEANARQQPYKGYSKLRTHSALGPYGREG